MHEQFAIFNPQKSSINFELATKNHQVATINIQKTIHQPPISHQPTINQSSSHQTSPSIRHMSGHHPPSTASRTQVQPTWPSLGEVRTLRSEQGEPFTPWVSCFRLIQGWELIYQGTSVAYPLKPKKKV